MKTYINKYLGFYEVDLELSDIFLTGETEFDYQNGAFVLLDESQLNFKQDNPDASPLEVFKKTLNILELKNRKTKEIDDYDKSDSVNCFYVNSQKMWIDRDTRVSLYHTASILTTETIRLWTQGESPIYFDIERNMFKLLLESIEIYAKAAYDVSSMHKYNVNNLTDYVEILNYDYKSGYPDKINISV